MLNLQKEIKIRSEILPSIKEAFLKAELNQKNMNDFILFLGLAYKDDMTNMLHIGSRNELYKHNHKSDIIKSYLSEVYGLSKLDYKNKLYFMTSIEMMFYTHVWESTLFLKILKNLSNLIAGRDYDWGLIIPNFGRSEFLLNIIKDFRDAGLSLAKIMVDVYDKDYRNAFAHGEYSFPLTNSQSGIRFYTKNQTVSFEKWQKRFLTTISLENIILLTFMQGSLSLPSNTEFDVSVVQKRYSKLKILIRQFDDASEFSWC